MIFRKISTFSFTCFSDKSMKVTSNRTDKADISLPRMKSAPLSQSTTLPAPSSPPPKVPSKGLLSAAKASGMARPGPGSAGAMAAGAVTSASSSANAGASTTPSGTATAKPKKSTSSRREELLKQLKAVEDAIARKRAKMN